MDLSALATHLLQSTIFAGVAMLLTLPLRANQARVRHAIWVVASLKFLIPFALLISLGTEARALIRPAMPPTRMTIVIEETRHTFTLPAVTLSLPAARPTSAVKAPAILLAIWFCGFAGVGIAWLARWRHVHKIARASTEEHLSRDCPIEIRSSQSVIEPGVFGIVRPVLLLPAGIVERLPATHLESILAHELCHVRRRDNLWSALHMVAEAVFWFHPLVWWIGARLVEERERACDEEVLRLGNAPEVYAESILKVCQFYLESPLPCVAGVTGANLKRRIEEIMTHRMSNRLNPGKKLMLAAAAALAIGAPIVFGLLTAAPSVRAQSQTAAPRSFEVASIKPSEPGQMGTRLMIAPGGNFNAKNATPQMLVEFAYNIRDFQISNAPGWLKSEHYDVTAKGDDGGSPNPDALRQMVQSLLAERFKLLIHRETKELPVYNLVVGKSGLKMKEVEVPGDGPDKDPGPGPGKIQGQGPGPGRGGMMRMGRGQLTGQAIKVDMLVSNLARQIGRTVIDKTGLKGAYDFKLEWTPEPGQGADLGEHTPIDPSGPTIFAALQEQLGLKLESAKGPVEIVVIDRIEKATEN